MSKKNISRRNFLKSAAALSAFPAIIPASAFGRSKTPPSNRITIGIIGSGGRGRNHASEIYRLKDQVQLLGVCDVNANNLKEMNKILSRMYKKKATPNYNDFRELIARDDLDAVSIAVPDHWHALIALEAANAGKHLYSEKPMAYSVKEGRAMVEAVEANKVVFQHGTQQRSMPKYRQACELILNGYLGEIHTIKVGSPFGIQGGETKEAPVPDGLDYEFWLGPAPAHAYTPGRCQGHGGVGWYHIRDYSGGWVTAWGSHDLDIAQWFSGNDATGPIAIEGRGDYAKDGVYDTLWKWHFEYEYAKGPKILFTTEDENPHGVRVEGSEGALFVNRQVLKTEPKTLRDLKFSDQDTRLPVSDHHYGNFIDCIKSGAPTMAPAETAQRSTTACHLGNIAVQTGRKLRWNAKGEHLVEDPEADKLLHRPMRKPWKL